MFLEGDDVFVEQADAAFAGTAGDGVLVVGAAMDADALMTGRFQTQEPVAVGFDAATAVLEVVMPCRCILDHGDLKGFAGGRLGCAHVATFHFIALVLSHTARELGHHNGVA